MEYVARSAAGATRRTRSSARPQSITTSGSDTPQVCRTVGAPVLGSQRLVGSASVKASKLLTLRQSRPGSWEAQTSPPRRRVLLLSRIGRLILPRFVDGQADRRLIHTE